MNASPQRVNFRYRIVVILNVRPGVCHVPATAPCQHSAGLELHRLGLEPKIQTLAIRSRVSRPYCQSLDLEGKNLGRGLESSVLVCMGPGMLMRPEYHEAKAEARKCEAKAEAKKILRGRGHEASHYNASTFYN